MTRSRYEQRKRQRVIAMLRELRAGQSGELGYRIGKAFNQLPPGVAQRWIDLADSRQVGMEMIARLGPINCAHLVERMEVTSNMVSCFVGELTETYGGHLSDILQTELSKNEFAFVGRTGATHEHAVNSDDLLRIPMVVKAFEHFGIEVLTGLYNNLTHSAVSWNNLTRFHLASPSEVRVLLEGQKIKSWRIAVKNNQLRILKFDEAMMMLLHLYAREYLTHRFSWEDKLKELFGLKRDQSIHIVCDAHGQKPNELIALELELKQFGGFLRIGSVSTNVCAPGYSPLCVRI